MTSPFEHPAWGTHRGVQVPNDKMAWGVARPVEGQEGTFWIERYADYHRARHACQDEPRVLVSVVRSDGQPEQGAAHPLACSFDSCATWFFAETKWQVPRVGKP